MAANNTATTEVTQPNLQTTLDTIVANNGVPAARIPDLLLELPVTEARALGADLVLPDPPEIPPGTLARYSNSNYILVGAALEEATGRNWEELLTTEVFKPLGMTSCGFGAPGVEDQANEPRGHDEDDTAVFIDNPPMLGPAGTVHCSMTDWGTFLVELLNATKGASDFLTQESALYLIRAQDTGSPFGTQFVKEEKRARSTRGTLPTEEGKNQVLDPCQTSDFGLQSEQRHSALRGDQFSEWSPVISSAQESERTRVRLLRASEAGTSFDATTELRWFASGHVDLDVLSWFNTASNGLLEERQDQYCVDDRHDVGVKRRSGETLELKVRQGATRQFELEGHHTGQLEAWYRWSPADDRIELPYGPAWIDVDKTIAKRRFDRDGLEIDLTTENRAMLGDGCDVEVASITIGPRHMWTFALAAFGQPERHLELLVSTWQAVNTPQRAPESLRLDPANSCGYPEWLIRACSVDQSD